MDNNMPTSGAKGKLSYDAARPSKRRRVLDKVVRAEHVILPNHQRNTVIAGVQDQQRNISLVAWMIRRHLDYVSQFKIQFRTGNSALDKLITRIFNWHASPDNFDIAGRLGREEMFRLFELEKVVAGDAAMIKLKNGYLQAIESDLIAYPKYGRYDTKTKRHLPLPPAVVDNVDHSTGVIMHAQYPGRVDKYCICNRLPNGKSITFDHLEDRANVIFDAYYTRYSSQVRGVSPLTTAINSVQDLAEGIDYNLIKAKMHALLGLAISRDADQSLATESPAALSFDGDNITDDSDNGAGGDAQPDEANAANAEETLKQLQNSIKLGSLLTLDLDPGEKVDTIESKTPSTEFREFTTLVIRLVLLALDIPYTAYDSRGTTFAGMIADQNLYEVSCRWKRRKNLWQRKAYANWLLERIWNADDDDPRFGDWGLRELANKAGINRLRELQEHVEWVPTGFPWLQKIQEVDGDAKAIALGLDNPIDAARRRGVDVFVNLDKTAEVYAYAKELGVPVVVGQPGQQVIDQDEGDGAKKDEVK